MLASPPWTRYSKACGDGGRTGRSTARSARRRAPPRRRRRAAGCPRAGQRRREVVEAPPPRPGARRAGGRGHRSTPVEVRSAGSSGAGLAARTAGKPVGQTLDDRAQGQDLGVGVGEEEDHATHLARRPMSRTRASTSRWPPGRRPAGRTGPARAAANDTPAGTQDAWRRGGHGGQEGRPGSRRPRTGRAGWCRGHGPSRIAGALAAGAVRVVERDPADGRGGAPGPPRRAAVVDLVAG